MTIFGRTISRITLAALGAILIIALIAFGTSQCSKRRNAAAQARTDAAQAGAAQNSAADAIGTVAKAGERDAASEDLTRANDRDIRAADGANDKVKAGVASAGLQALCRRNAYKDDPRCAQFRKAVR